MFKNPFSLHGRIRRTEYCLSYVIFLTLYLSYFAAINFDPDFSYAIILWIPLLWFRIAQSTKRCHDLGYSGWYQLIPFYVFFLMFAKGNLARNKYGHNPKFPHSADEIDEIGRTEHEFNLPADS